MCSYVGTSFSSELKAFLILKATARQYFFVAPFHLVLTIASLFSLSRKDPFFQACVVDVEKYWWLGFYYSFEGYIWHLLPLLQWSMESYPVHLVPTDGRICIVVETVMIFWKSWVHLGDGICRLLWSPYSIHLCPPRVLSLSSIFFYSPWSDHDVLFYTLPPAPQLPRHSSFPLVLLVKDIDVIVPPVHQKSWVYVTCTSLDHSLLQLLNSFAFPGASDG